jgi:hypothetical protein
MAQILLLDANLVIRKDAADKRDHEYPQFKRMHGCDALFDFFSSVPDRAQIQTDC